MPKQKKKKHAKKIASLTQDQKVTDILLRENYIRSGNVADAEKYIKSHPDSTRVNYFISKELISKNLLGQAIAESLNVSYADLSSYIPSKEQVLRIPEEIAIRYRAVFFKEDEKEVVIATENPRDMGLFRSIKKIFKKKKITLAYSLPEDIGVVLGHYQKGLETRFEKIIRRQSHVAPEILEEIIEDALSFHASDIHFEPQKEEVTIRFRIDGAMRIAGKLPKEIYRNILNRIKILSEMRIDEHLTTQDGAIRYEKDGQDINMRVSIIPTLEGEKVAIRILSEYVGGLSLNNLGFSQKDQELFLRNSQKPFGMILVSGPTGSGKSTTLYALLKIMNQPDVNITTIEDPVEYKIPGINQIQINLKTDLTFAKGLRSIVRQDPDIVLVGEIRDNETADISVNAALTGHLLLSTFHANDASTSIPRLIDMGIEPFLLASTLELIVSQRLVRRTCQQCRYSYTEKVVNLKKLLPNIGNFIKGKTITLYKGKGCSSCNGTGFKGRIAIFEMIGITREIEDLILTHPSGQQIWDLAAKQGAHSLFDDGIEKVKSGITTIEELLRVANPPEVSGKRLKR